MYYLSKNSNFSVFQRIPEKSDLQIRKQGLFLVVFKEVKLECFWLVQRVSQTSPRTVFAEVSNHISISSTGI